jgi:bifunctional DNA-binding transcriptional regulator/antitoxin component of YhaV-PrlF toxin-antitoxin module
MSTRSAKVLVSETGRLSLPVDFRREMGIERGGVVTLELTGGRVTMRTLDQVFADARAKAKQAGWNERLSVADFLDYRAEQARLERAKSPKK